MALMIDSNLPMYFWAETASNVVHQRTLYELWHKENPNIRYMKRFGSIVYWLNI